MTQQWPLEAIRIERDQVGVEPRARPAPSLGEPGQGIVARRQQGGQWRLVLRHATNVVPPP
jgi:hypothetical protein